MPLHHVLNEFQLGNSHMAGVVRQGGEGGEGEEEGIMRAVSEDQGRVREREDGITAAGVGGVGDDSGRLDSLVSETMSASDMNDMVRSTSEREREKESEHQHFECEIGGVGGGEGEGGSWGDRDVTRSRSHDELVGVGRERVWGLGREGRRVSGGCGWMEAR